MGLSNNYVGETEFYATEPALYSRLWIHLFANRQSRAYTDDEAVELGTELKKQFGSETLSDEKISELLDDQMLDLSGDLGRGLEDDEEKFLEENTKAVVIDI